MHSLAGMLPLSDVIHSNSASCDIGKPWVLLAKSAEEIPRSDVYGPGCQCFSNTLRDYILAPLVPHSCDMCP